MRLKLHFSSYFLAAGLFFVFIPTPVLAQNISNPSERTQLLAQIEALLSQIASLQELLRERESMSGPDRPRLSVVENAVDNEFELIETYYFGTDFKAIYEVDERLNLIRRDIATGIRLTDLRLWDLFVDTIGRNETKYYIDEFRVFDRPSSDIGAFVELHRSNQKPDYWILGINEDDFDPNDNASRRRYQILFIHEYAHLFIEDQEDVLEDFTDQFWSAADHQHAKRLETIDREDINDKLENYFKNNEDDFVSDYATYNPEEDFAETFVYFVANDRPRSSRDLWADKVDFMFDNFYLRDVRYQIRNNLNL